MSDRLLQWILRLYPAGFRAAYGEAMLQVFRDQLRDAPGWSGRARVWLRLLFETPGAAMAEHHRPPESPQGYTVSAAGYRAMVRSGHLGGHFLAPWFVATLLALAWLPGSRAAWLPAAAGVALLLASRSRFRAHWRGYGLRLDETSLGEFRYGALVHSCALADIQRVVEAPGYGLSVLARAPSRSLWIPASLTGYGELRERLGARTRIEVISPRHHGRPPLFLAVLFAGLLAIFVLWIRPVLVP